MIATDTPQALAAAHYMGHKGLGEVQPYEVEKVENEHVWYFLYELEEGRLELEVSWTPEGGWEFDVTSFVLT